jgi:hypothetical protein
MVISHSRRFIFLRTQKTGGSSLSHALRATLQPEDYRAHRRLPLWQKRLGLRSRWPKTRFGGPFGLTQHATARQVRRFVGEEAWRGYFKFAVERNPWDRQLSLYHQRCAKRGRRPDFRRDMASPWWRATHHVRLDNWSVYAIGEKVVADRVLRYEELEETLPALMTELGVGPLELPRLRSGHRPKRDYREEYDGPTRELVARWYRREIEAFGYAF